MRIFFLILLFASPVYAATVETSITIVGSVITDPPSAESEAQPIPTDDGYIAYRVKP